MITYVYYINNCITYVYTCTNVHQHIGSNLELLYRPVCHCAFSLSSWVNPNMLPISLHDHAIQQTTYQFYLCNSVGILLSVYPMVYHITVLHAVLRQ